VDGIVAQTAIEILRHDPFMSDLAGGEAVLEPAFGVAAQGHVTNDAPGIGERRLNGMDAKDEQPTVPLGAGLGLTPAGAMAMPVVHGSRG